MSVIVSVHLILTSSLLCPFLRISPCLIAFSTRICMNMDGNITLLCSSSFGKSKFSSNPSPNMELSSSMNSVTKDISSRSVTHGLLVMSRLARRSFVSLRSASSFCRADCPMLALRTLNTKCGEIRCLALLSRNVCISILACIFRLRYVISPLTIIEVKPSAILTKSHIVALLLFTSATFSFISIW